MQFALIEPYLEAWRCYSLAPASVDPLRCDRMIADPSRLWGWRSRCRRNSPTSDVLLHPKAPPLRTPMREEAVLATAGSETFVTGAAFGSAGESDTVERPRTPSVVSNFSLLRALMACLEPSFERRVRRALHPFVLSSSPPASTGSNSLTRGLDDSFRTRPRVLLRGERGRKMHSTDFCLPTTY